MNVSTINLFSYRAPHNIMHPTHTCSKIQT